LTAAGHEHRSRECAAATQVATDREEILARSSFRHVQQLVYEFDRPWTLERRLLGERRTAFEQAITDALLAIDPDGRFTEAVILEALVATKG
jgi:hypothetical protein